MLRFLNTKNKVSQNSFIDMFHVCEYMYDVMNKTYIKQIDTLMDTKTGNNKNVFMS